MRRSTGVATRGERRFGGHVSSDAAYPGRFAVPGPRPAPARLNIESVARVMEDTDAYRLYCDDIETVAPSDACSAP